MNDIDLTNPRQLVTLLQKHHLYTKKKLGQNFLINRSVINASIAAANIQSTDTVIEIGAGTGVLTQQLSAQAKQVYAYEIDSSLQPLLNDTLAGLTNVQLNIQDFKQADLSTIAKHDPYKVVANLPYNAGTHILGQLIQLPQPPQSITVLLQKEVAQKITATPPHATYLSNFIALFGQTKIVQVIPPSSFFPAPKVDSAILHISRNPEFTNNHLGAMSGFLHRGFANPRKKINKAFTVDQLQKAGVDPNLRPENLNLSDWINLFNVIKASE